MKKTLLILLVFTFSLIELNATHFVGGDVHFEQTSANNYTITLRLFREYCNGNATAPTSITNAGIYDEVTHAGISTSITLPQVSIDTVIFGDACYTPTGLCVEVYTYRTTITLANNPNGYYFTWHSCCRNNAITNMDPDGMTWEAHIPDPALTSMNSSPKWGPYPSDGYFCINNNKDMDLSCTDADGDSLVYSLVQPLDAGPGFSSDPITFIPLLGFRPTFSMANILGPGSLMTINSATGVVTARPAAPGIYVFRIRCEEYRSGVKIGEVFLDLQYEALNCTYDLPPSFDPFPDIAVLGFDTLGCFDIVATDPNITDPFFISIESNTYGYGGFMTLPPVNTSPAGTYTFNYIDTNTGLPAAVTAPVTQLSPTTFQGNGTIGARFCWSPDSCQILEIDSFKMEVLAYSQGCDSANDTLSREVAIEVNNPSYQPFVPNVFSPNNDGANDFYNLPKSQHNRCYDVIHVEIYNRWGQKVFESDDPLFQWDGKDSGGSDLKQGTYYVLLQGYYGAQEVTDQFPVTLFR